LVIYPFVNARDLKAYATRGYFLLGVLSVIAILISWPLLSYFFSYLPTNLRGGLNSFFQWFGIKNDSYILLLSLLGLYLIGFLIRPLRHFFGETAANLFFGAVDINIRIGEWCLEHRWWSLLILIVLAGVISGGSYHLIREHKNHERVKLAFSNWCDQASKFVDLARVTEDQSEDYQQRVNSLWNDNFETIIQRKRNGDPHPAFVLRKILQAVHGTIRTESNWHEFLKNKRNELDGYLADYEPPQANAELTEKQFWALINIFMGRLYARLGDDAPKTPEQASIRRNWLAAAHDYFSKIDESYAPEYQDAAQNGLGTVYADVLTPPLVRSDDLTREMIAICGQLATPETCATLALRSYAKVHGAECSYQRRRRENNTVDLLARIGINYAGLKVHLIDLKDVCGNVADEQTLSACIERRIGLLMNCTASQPPFLWVQFITVAQAFGASTELLKGKALPLEVQARAAAAGKYLRLAYALSLRAQTNLLDMQSWSLDYFRFATNDDEVANAFWIGFESAMPSEMPKPDIGKLKGLIKEPTWRKSQ
jgi:hypothetical protein